MTPNRSGWAVVLTIILAHLLAAVALMEARRYHEATKRLARELGYELRGDGADRPGEWHRVVP